MPELAQTVFSALAIKHSSLHLYADNNSLPQHPLRVMFTGLIFLQSHGIKRPGRTCRACFYVILFLPITSS